MWHFGERCRFYEGKTWSKICTGRYSEDISIRFQNNVVQIGDRYAVFEADKNQFLVTMGNSPIMREERIELKGTNFINADSNKIIENIYAMTCLPYRFRFTEEIVRECTRRKKVIARDTILNYPRYEEMVERLMARNLSSSHRNCSNFFNGTNYWPLIIVAVILIFIMFFYKTRF